MLKSDEYNSHLYKFCFILYCVLCISLTISISFPFNIHVVSRGPVKTKNLYCIGKQDKGDKYYTLMAKW
jgi:hypothetical protein